MLKLQDYFIVLKIIIKDTKEVVLMWFMSIDIYRLRN